MIEKAKTYAVDCHNMTGHKYDGKSYETHLQMVFDTANKFIHLIPFEHQENVLAACWVHDVIEDCFATFIKLCDRIANYEYSKIQGSRMAEMYEKEMDSFVAKLYDVKYEELFNYLNRVALKV